MTESAVAKRPVDNIYLLWALLAVPVLWLVAVRVGLLPGKAPFLIWTGLVSCWLLIFTMAITPIQMIVGPLPWLRKRRRYFGVASFVYALLHLIYWLSEASWKSFIASFTRESVLPGWIAFVLMIPLAATSFDLAVRKLGPNWKRLQRWIYPMAILTLIHWAMTTADLMDVVIYCGPLVALEIWRVYRNRARMRSG